MATQATETSSSEEEIDYLLINTLKSVCMYVCNSSVAKLTFILKKKFIIIIKSI